MCIFLINRPWEDRERYTWYQSMVLTLGPWARCSLSYLCLFCIFLLCSDWKLIHELFTLQTQEAWMLGEEEVEGLGGVVRHLFCSLHLHVIHQQWKNRPIYLQVK